MTFEFEIFDGDETYKLSAANGVFTLRLVDDLTVTFNSGLAAREYVRERSRRGLGAVVGLTGRIKDEADELRLLAFCNSSYFIADGGVYHVDLAPIWSGELIDGELPEWELMPSPFVQAGLAGSLGSAGHRYMTDLMVDLESRGIEATHLTGADILVKTKPVVALAAYGQTLGGEFYPSRIDMDDARSTLVANDVDAVRLLPTLLAVRMANAAREEMTELFPDSFDVIQLHIQKFHECLLSNLQAANALPSDLVVVARNRDHLVLAWARDPKYLRTPRFLMGQVLGKKQRRIREIREKLELPDLQAVAC